MKAEGRWVFLLIIIIGAAGIYSCGIFSRPLTIITDDPQVADYLEFIRGASEHQDFHIEFSSEADRSAAIGGSQADIIISSSIANQAFSPFIHSYPLRRWEQLTPARDSFVFADLYPGSYRPFIRDKRLGIVPLSFNLPIVYFNQEMAAARPDTHSIGSSDLLRLAEEYTRIRGENYSEMGFSSLRDIRFLDILIRQETSVRGRVPDSSTLEPALETIRSELEQLEQRPPAQLYFNSVFAYSADHADMEARRIHSALSSLHEHLQAGPSRIREFSYKWLYSDDGAEVIQPIMYSAVLDSSRNTRRAFRFLRKILSSEFQSAYFEFRVSRDDSPVGFLQGFSSSRLVNERVLSASQAGPELPVPPAEQIIFPAAPDYLWNRVRNEVYYPWLQDYLYTENVTAGDLEADIESFYKLNSRYR
ncbi:hypothetical protein [Salinispira pacifica]|uniref:Uncharacterized protein n=1 Tax=Salinispira pacifica TaxID=1307761 RepID=V5WDL5_9SPIO|nr:hypothetical protein [Salinispira pacifica]AHC13654.1 hypothetical protein L21SP2_0212 [Salinispira pacifica]